MTQRIARRIAAEDVADGLAVFSRSGRRSVVQGLERVTADWIRFDLADESGAAWGEVELMLGEHFITSFEAPVDAELSSEGVAALAADLYQLEQMTAV